MSPSRRRIPASLALLACAVLLPACAGTLGSAPRSRELSSSQFADVPVPRGFGLDDANVDTFTYSEGGNHRSALRMGRLIYEGSAPVEAVVEYYEAEMPRPIHGWDAGKRLSDRGDGAVRVLFQRPEDRCLVRVHASGGMTHLVIERNTGEALSLED